jgi:3-dehydroquinate synthase
VLVPEKSPGSPPRVSYSTCTTLPYPIHVGSGLLSHLPSLVPAIGAAHRVAIISDTTIAPLYADRVAAAIGKPRCIGVHIAPGEAHKTRATWSSVTDQLLEARMGRDSLIIALGGGVIGDLAGFVAATFLRGIPFVQLPTTLLAMVDASIGGKTGVDTIHGKNLVGAFHPPIAVISDVDTLASLNSHQRASGMAEVLKHALIADSAYLDTLLALAWDQPVAAEVWQGVILRSVEIKAAVVAKDERESGLRKTLNFGHTIGHAIEVLLGYTLPHGHCIALGMVIEARIAVALGICDPSLPQMIEQAARHLGLPTIIPAALTPDAIIAATRHDKKARQGQVEYALPVRCGEMARNDGSYAIAVGDDTVLAALASR